MPEPLGVYRADGRGWRPMSATRVPRTQRAGLKAAEAHGRRGGRKPVVTEEKLRRARDLIAKGLTTREAATRIKVGKIALCKALHPLP